MTHLGRALAEPVAENEGGISWVSLTRAHVLT
jgi:hypothetical protein